MTEVKVPIVNSVELFDDEELMGLADAIVRGKPLTDHHLQSANHLYSSGLKDIITRTFNIGRKIVNQRNSTEDEKKIARIDCALRFTDIYIKRPFFNKENVEVPLTPMVAMRTGRVYGGSLSVDFDVEANAISADGSVIATRKESVSNYAIANVPIIKGSILCHTYGKTDQELKVMNESICDPGGYLIFGHPYAIDNTESTTFNRPKVYFTTGNNNGVIRLDFLSKAGDSNENSDMLIITYHHDNRITIQINRNKLSGVQFPFFTLFRILGWVDDKTVFDHIVQDYNDETNGNILKILKEAMTAPYGTVKNRSYVDIIESMECVDSMVESIPSAKISYLNLGKVPSNRHIIIEEVINTIDTYFLPHIGTIPDVRNQKLRFLAMLVRKILKVFLGVSAPTDRDSYTIKRMNTAGDNLSKTIKQIFGRVVAASAGRAIVTKFRELPFNMVPLAQMIKNSIKLSSFENFLNQIIATSRFENSGLGNQLVTNRLGAQRIEPKNITHQISTLRQVSSNQGNISSKQSDRSVQMRQVHNSGVAYICPIHSPPEGAGVGTKKQLALGAEIARPSQSVFIRMLLRKDEYVIVEENVLYPADISTKEYAYVYVNGNLVGYTQYPYYLVDKYRKLRRQKQIDIQATIYWDTNENEVHFFVDIGRMTRLITIVYNNKRDECFRNVTSVKSLNGTKKLPKSAKSTVDYATATDFENFFQYTLLTKKDIEQLNSGKKTIANLIDEQKIEYISTEEQNANCFICPDIARLNQECYNPERPYTHVDIPQLLLGITALKVPYGSHNQVTRNVYATSHVKQACSLPVDNWPYNTEKGTFVMTTLESPVVTTFIDNYLPPSGNNTIIAINCSHGENQEDSIVMAKGAVERGLFSGAKYNTIDVILDPKETIGIPNEELTDKKKSGNFSKLTNGIVQPGVIIENGDIVIAKFMKTQNLSKTKNQKTILIDKSIRYDKDSQGIIVDVLFCDNANERCIKIKYVKICELEVGDKLSSRAGQKGILGRLLNDSDMPTTTTGIRPDIIFNPHGIPTRMTIGTLIETLVAKVCAIRGANYDGTFFKKIDIDAISDMLEKLGYNRHGYEYLIDGMTGEYIRTAIFMGPNFYQRLLKFVADTQYCVTHPKMDAVTRQPRDGQGYKGGLRIGEMERDVIMSHGSASILAEKYGNHSDGIDEYICRCGTAAIVNTKENIYKCNNCGDAAEIFKIKSTWAAMMFREEIKACGIGFKLAVDPIHEVTSSNHFEKIETYTNDVTEKLSRMHMTANGINTVDIPID